MSEAISPAPISNEERAAIVIQKVKDAMKEIRVRVDMYERDGFSLSYALFKIIRPCSDIKHLLRIEGVVGLRVKQTVKETIDAAIEAGELDLQSKLEEMHRLGAVAMATDKKNDNNFKNIIREFNKQALPLIEQLKELGKEAAAGGARKGRKRQVSRKTRKTRKTRKARK
jgi:hypothetical protein